MRFSDSFPVLQAYEIRADCEEIALLLTKAYLENGVRVRCLSLLCRGFEWSWSENNRLTILDNHTPSSSGLIRIPFSITHFKSPCSKNQLKCRAGACGWGATSGGVPRRFPGIKRDSNSLADQLRVGKGCHQRK